MKNHFVDGGEGRQGRHVGFPHGNLGSGEPDMSCATFVPGFLPDIPGFTMEVFLGSPLATCQVKLPGTGASGDPTVGDLAASWTFPSVSHGHPINNL